MAAYAAGIALTSLNDCFRFLYWLNKDGKGKEMQSQVAEKLRDHLAQYYNNPDKDKIQSSLSRFLGHVDKVYITLVKDGIPEQQLLSGASMSPDEKIKKPDILVEALLECLPKFLAAIYFLWYNVSYRFKKVGGSKWAMYCPGAISSSWWGSSGGELDKYLISNTPNNYGGLIPGGFVSYELRYGWYYSGYERGFQMGSDLDKIFGKDGGLLFRDVFATSVLYDTYGIAKQNAANALALVNKFCEIVGKEAKNNNGVTLKAKLDEEIIKKRKCSINWESLKLHCEHLQQQLGKIFKDEGFSFTGYGRGIGELKAVEFAQKTADWLRKHLDNVRGNLAKIRSFTTAYDNFDMRVYREGAYQLTQYYADLGPHFTENLFPYGFTFHKADFRTLTAPYQGLRHAWENAISMLCKDAEDGGLRKLKKLLDGEPCAPGSSLEARPSAVPARAAHKPGPSGAKTLRSSGPRGGGGVTASRTSTLGKQKPSGVGGRRGGRGGGTVAQSTRGQGQQRPGAKGVPGTRRMQPAASAQTQPLQTQINSHMQHQQAPAAGSEGSKDVSPEKQAPVMLHQKTNTLPTTAAESPPKVMPEQKTAAEGNSSEPTATKTEETKTEAAKPVATKTEATKTEAAKPVVAPSATNPDQAKKSEAVQNQGKADVHTPGQNNSQSEEQHGGSPGKSDDSDLASSDKGDAGPEGLTGRGTQVSSQSLGSEQQPVVQALPGQPQVPAPPTSQVSSPSVPEPATAGSSGDSIAASPGSASPGLQPAASQASVIPQPPSVTDSVSQHASVIAPSGASSPDSDQGDSQHSQQNGLSSTSKPDSTNSTPPGQGVAPGSGEATGGTDGHSKDSLKSIQAPTPGDSIEASTSSVGSGLPGSPGLTPMSSPQENSNDHASGTSDSSSATASHDDVSDTVGGADAAAEPNPQVVTNQDNESQGEPRQTLPAPAAASPSTPDPVSPNTASNSDSGLQRIDHSAQDAGLPQASGLTQAASTQSVGSSSSGVSDTDIVMGSQVTKGDQGAPGPVTLNSSPQRVQTDPQSVHQEPSQATSSPDSATSPTAIPVPSSKPGNADGGDQALQNNSHSGQSHLISQGTAVSQLASVSGSVPSPTGSLGSDQIKLPNAQLGSQNDLQSSKDSQQSLSATTMTTSAVKSSDSGISVPGGVGTSSIVQLPVPNIKISCEVGKFDANTSDTNSMVVPKEQTNTLPKVIVDVIKPTVATYGDHFQSTPSLTLPVSFLPSYDAINDESDKTKEMRSNSEGNVELFIDVAKYPSPQPLAKYDAEDISAPPKLGKPKVADLYDSAPKAAESPTFYTPLVVFPGQSPFDGNPNVCQNPYYVPDNSTDLIPPIVTIPPDTDHLPPPRTVKAMLFWLVGVVELGYIGFIRKHVDVVLDDVNTGSFLPTNVLLVTRNHTTVTSYEISQTLTAACHYAAKVLHRVKHRDISKDTSIPKFDAEYGNYYYSSDPDGLLCQLCDYVYACCHQLQFLKAQCGRALDQGGWKDYTYGRGIKDPSPLQSFLTDSGESTFHTHFFDPCDICLKSRIKMGFKQKDLPEEQKQGNVISSILTPSCGDDDPLMTLAAYLNCLTRRTPRTTGELVSFFDLVGNELHSGGEQTLTDLGIALITEPPALYPNWDHLEAHDLRAVRDIRRPESPVSKHDDDHAGSLSTLLGCDTNNVRCTQVLSPITYRAYALYSPTFAHTYLSWAVYLADTLRESLDRLRYDLTRHGCSGNKSFHQCDKAMPLLYLHGLTPPEGISQSSLACSELISKLGEVVNGGPIAKLITCMDEFHYRVRGPFIYTVIALWSTALLLFWHVMVNRLDTLHIRSHLVRSTASHRIDVKALLTKGRKMLSLYGVDYFDDDPMLS